MARRYNKRSDTLVRYEQGEVTADQVEIARRRTAVHLRNIHMVDEARNTTRPATVDDDGLDYQREGVD